MFQELNLPPHLGYGIESELPGPMNILSTLRLAILVRRISIAANYEFDLDQEEEQAALERSVRWLEKAERVEHVRSVHAHDQLDIA